MEIRYVLCKDQYKVQTLMKTLDQEGDYTLIYRLWVWPEGAHEINFGGNFGGKSWNSNKT